MEFDFSKERGILVVIEGAHGSGKTTQARLLEKHLQKAGYIVKYTKEPFSNNLRQQISFFSTRENLEPLVLAYLIAADRYIHLKEISRMISKSDVIISDRYLPSSFVYQSMQGINETIIRQLNSFVPKPDLLFLLDVPLSIRIRRIKKAKMMRRYHVFLEKENLVKEQELYDAYKHTIHEKFVRFIDGNLSKNVIGGMIAPAVTKVLDAKRNP